MFSKLAKAKDAAPVRPLPSYRGKDIAMMALNKAQAEKIRLFKLNSKTNKPIRNLILTWTMNFHQPQQYCATTERPLYSVT